MTRERRAALLAFLTAFVTLFVQVLVHRMVSAKLLNNYAFLVISLTMLGFASSAVVLTRSGRAYSSFDQVFPWAAALFALTLLGHEPASSTASPNPERLVLSRTDLVLQLLSCLPWAILFAVPFFFCGLDPGGPPLRPGAPHAADLLLRPPGLGRGGGRGDPRHQPPRGGEERGRWRRWSCSRACSSSPGPSAGRRRLRRWRGALRLVLASAALRGPALRHELSARCPSSARPRFPGSGYVLERVFWDPIARIEVVRTPPPDPDTLHLAGPGGVTNRDFLSRFRRMLTQNNNAFTYAVDYDGDVDSLQGIEETIYAAAYEATSVERPARARHRRGRRVRRPDRAPLRGLRDDRGGGERGHPRHPAPALPRLLRSAGRATRASVSCTTRGGTSWPRAPRAST